MEVKCIEYKNGKGYLPIKVERLGLKLRHFGNYCNLSCVMCNPWNSTTRKKELEDTNTMKIPALNILSNLSIEWYLLNCSMLV